MIKGIIDFHTHAFPDALAPKAMKRLMAEAPGVKAFLDGTIKSLLESMDKNGIDISVLCCIATTPEQFMPIFNWCKNVQSDRLIMFPSIHPADTKLKERIGMIKAEGFIGIKVHPFYQDFHLDEDRMFPIYEEITKNNLMLVSHTGYDIAFERDSRADCKSILQVSEKFPQLKFITTHLGAWQQWDDVEQKLAGKPDFAQGATPGRHIYMETSWSLEYLSSEQAKRIILGMPSDCVLFGTDSPWTDQGKTISLLKNLKLPQDLENKILYDNAISLLGLK